MGGLSFISYGHPHKIKEVFMTDKQKIKLFTKHLKKQTMNDNQYANLLACLIEAINYFATEEGSIVKTLTIKIKDGYPTKVNMSTGEYTHSENESI